MNIAALALAATLACPLVAQGSPEKGKPAKPDVGPEQEQAKSQGDAGKAKLPKLPPNKSSVLDELLRKYGSGAKTGAKTDATTRAKNARARDDAPAARTSGDEQGSQDPATKKDKPKSKLDKLDEIVRKARERRLARARDREYAANMPNNPFVGTWNIVNISRDARRGRSGGGGYVIFTPAFISMHIFAPATAETNEPRWQSSMRRYWLQGGQLVTSSLLGIGNQGDGESIVIEQGGRREVRRFLFLAPDSLRIIQGTNRYIDLRLIERF